MSFLDFCFSSNWERESGIQNLGIKENVPKVTYLIFRRDSTGESFFFHGLIDFILFFFTGLKNLGSLKTQLFFCLQPGVLAMVRLPATDPAQKLKLSYLLPLRGRGPHFRFGIPANHLASLFFPLVSGDLRLLSTNTCDPHSLLTVTFFLTARYC